MKGAGKPRARIVLSPDEGEAVEFGGFGVRFMIDGAHSEGNVALVEHPIGPRVLAAPMHTHRHEDEYTYVLEGEIGVQVGDEVRVARTGDLVFKPRGVPHAFWNAGDTPARALEIISPAGFERYFAEIASLLPPNHHGPPDVQALLAVQEKYGLEMDMASIPPPSQSATASLPASLPPEGCRAAPAPGSLTGSRGGFLAGLRLRLSVPGDDVRQNVDHIPQSH